MKEFPGRISSISTDETLDAASVTPADSARLARHVELIEGSGPQLSCEMRVLLRCRLRLSALVMCFGFVLFLLRDLFTSGNEIESNVLFSAHVAVTILLGLCGLDLCRTCPKSVAHLRLKELLIFGGPAAFFAVLQYFNTRHCAAMNFLPSISESWLLLMFTYAMFIPNDWRRAAAIIGAMATVPAVLLVWLLLTDSACAAAHNSGLPFVSAQILSLAIGAVGAVVGVATINSLRSEAFEARQLGRYQLRKLLGRGGMGDVYLAEHQMMKRPCAIKVIRPERAGDPRALARFEREVRSISKLSHWNSVHIFDYGRTSDGTFYYVMEYLPGMTLQELVERSGPLSASRVIHLLRQACAALSEAHGVGLVHRDLKPANIFVAERGGIHDVVKILDFGLAKPVANVDQVQLSVDGVITGSPLYMSPEQALGDGDADATTDIYSLGATAYFLITGRPPFDGDKPLKVLFAHASQNVVPPSSYQPSVPSDLEDVVLKCLAKESGDRYPSAAALSQALDQCHDAGQWTDHDANDWWRQREWTPETDDAAVLV